MKSKLTWRKTALILLGLNIFLLLWMHGGLRFMGLGAKDVSEPERLDMQVIPQAMMLNDAASQAKSH
ncbi:MAG: hypothetical protein RLY90_122 [Pseudomonadota bacterium]|jgi:hypothetical protein